MSMASIQKLLQRGVRYEVASAAVDVAAPAALTSPADMAATYVEADIQALRNDVAAIRTTVAALVTALDAIGATL